MEKKMENHYSMLKIIMGNMLSVFLKRPVYPPVTLRKSSFRARESAKDDSLPSTTPALQLILGNLLCTSQD